METHDIYEQQVKEMTDGELLEEANFAHSQMRQAWRDYEIALGRCAIVFGERERRSPFDDEEDTAQEAIVLPLQRQPFEQRRLVLIEGGLEQEV